VGEVLKQQRNAVAGEARNKSAAAAGASIREPLIFATPCRAKRVGGELRHFFLPANPQVVAARKVRRSFPVAVTLQ
jgi:hypothetical protein